MKKYFTAILFFISIIFVYGRDQIPYKFTEIPLTENVNSYTWLIIQRGMKLANENNSDAILINMNTYGGEVVYADSIRSKLLNSEKPVYVFINNNAASAGALISIACDKIFMKPGATIGASTVVSGTGKAAPDKYQSYMRAMMRSTAESHGKDTIITGKDTIFKWKRNPSIAEAMVDQDIYIKGITDSGKVLTFTAEEALNKNFCDAIVKDIPQLINKELKINNYVIEQYKPSGAEKVKGKLMSSVFRSILIIIIIAGIYFELQSPGIGFPTIISILAAVLYFAPLLVEGVAQYWEIIVFVIGIILMLLEIFVIPGFGVAGISGILCIIIGLTFGLVDNADFSFSAAGLNYIEGPFLLVLGSIIIAVILSLWLTSKIGKGKGLFRNIALNADQKNSEGYIGVPKKYFDMIGKEGVAITMLRPSGKIEVEGSIYDAVAYPGYIDEGKKIKVTKYESGQLYVTELRE